MDIFENFFKFTSNFLTKKVSEKKRSRAAFFEEEFQILTLLATVASGGEPLKIKPTNAEACIQGNLLWIPDQINSYENKFINRFVLLHFALTGGANYNQSFTDRNSLRNYLSNIFPGYRLWESQFSNIDILINLNRIQSKNQILREFDAASLSRSASKNVTTEQKRGPVGPVEFVGSDDDKNRSPQNPTMHSFEKLETADEYHGENRFMDGEDDLNNHSNALSELNLNKVIRTNKSSDSIYKSDIADIFESQESGLTLENGSNFLFYPEWNYKNYHLQPRHCRLYPSQDENKYIDNTNYKQELENRYFYLLNYWQKSVSEIYNDRIWENKCLEGEELDIDSYITYVSDINSSGYGDAKIFKKRKHGNRDISTLILLDQSYSTDSYVSGCRILDIELETIGLAGLLLEKTCDQVAVAGTYSETRSHCYFKTYKSFKDSWNSFYSSVPHIQPIGYTRLGPSIRHATKLLCETGSKIKLLLILTDGKPTDYDQYEGKYGIEDIYHAFLEANQSGIEFRAIAIDEEAKHYFPKIFGKNKYQILSDPKKLPEYLFRIYLEIAK